MRKFDYETKIYSKKHNLSISFLAAGIVGTVPNELNKLPKNSRVLDIGCGAGFYTGEILKKNSPQLDLYGIDISKTAINIAQKDYPEIKFKVANADELPFQDKYFDVVMMNCTLEHLETPHIALQEAKRVLKKGGLFFSITPIEGDSFVFFQNEDLTKKFHGHLQRFDRQKLIRLINKNGFEMKRYYFTGYLFCQLISGVYLRLFKMLDKPQEFQLSDSKLNPIKYLINFLINMESLLVPNKIPGLYMHVICVKRK